MDVHFTPAHEVLIRHAIESGRLRHEEDAVKQALSLWEERERRRAEILGAVYQVEASFARGEGRRIASREGVTQFADDAKRRGPAHR